MALIDLADVTVNYGDTFALRNVNLRIEPGELASITGPSGSGKSTLLHVIAGVIKPTSGTARVEGLDLKNLDNSEITTLRRRRLGFVFQNGQLLSELLAVENVALPLIVDGVPRKEAQERAAALFKPLGLDGLETRRPGQLSGGQAQRVAIARALVTEPLVVLADEPTGALDRKTGFDVLSLLLSAARSTGTALIVVTHDPDIASQLDRQIQVLDGSVTSSYEAK